jgi:hypothetical protein
MAEQGSEFSDGLDRRSFMKRMAVGVFIVPAVASFKLDSLARAGTPGLNTPGLDHKWPNQSRGNQTHPKFCFPNQTHGNQTFPKHLYANQTFPPRHNLLLDFVRKVCRPRPKPI